MGSSYWLRVILVVFEACFVQYLTEPWNQESPRALVSSDISKLQSGHWGCSLHLGWSVFLRTFQFMELEKVYFKEKNWIRQLWIPSQKRLKFHGRQSRNHWTGSCGEELYHSSCPSLCLLKNCSTITKTLTTPISFFSMDFLVVCFIF